MARSLGSKSSIAQALCISGRIYAQRGRIEKATAYFKEAIQMLSDIGNIHELAKAYYWFAVVPACHREECMKRATEIFRKVGAHAWLGKCREYFKRR
jgi:tetratricopeptide (TPR) repeat protein